MESLDRPKSQRNWVREEVCLLVAEYFRTKGLSSAEKEKSQEFVSKVLRSREKKITNAPLEALTLILRIKVQQAPCSRREYFRSI